MYRNLSGPRFLSPLFWGCVLSIALFGNACTAYLVFALGWSELYSEGELLESLQAAFLVLAGVVYLTLAFAAEKELRLAFLTGSLLCVSFFLREVDVQYYQLPAIVVMLGSGMGRNLMLLLAWAALAVAIARNLKEELPAFRHCIFSPAGYILMVGGAFVIAGALFDKELLPVAHHACFEELAELDGYYFVLLSSLVAQSFNGKPKATVFEKQAPAACR
ncbi:hypothetical protein [Candidatus Laterigemmans baculatus]|uniref:hypothetical protein n=1 Tax=Candidatus Laterigemmans baculatus TaxID=2770505 RepID=UPI0013D945C0|nr:hypothetical protein [Candidatus Laterigemmans baculatus]